MRAPVATQDSDSRTLLPKSLSSIGLALRQAMTILDRAIRTLLDWFVPIRLTPSTAKEPNEPQYAIQAPTPDKEVMMTLSRLAAVAALSLVFGAPIAAQPTGPTVLVWNYGFSPQPLQLVADRPVTLTFVNRSGSSHDFTAKTFFATSRIIRGDAADGEVELAPHETKSVTLIPRRGRYGAHCSHFFHKQLGMSDQIFVY